MAETNEQGGNQMTQKQMVRCPNVVACMAELKITESNCPHAKPHIIENKYLCGGDLEIDCPACQPVVKPEPEGIKLFPMKHYLTTEGVDEYELEANRQHNLLVEAARKEVAREIFADVEKAITFYISPAYKALKAKWLKE
jgi:hypothetical protein